MKARERDDACSGAIAARSLRPRYERHAPRARTIGERRKGDLHALAVTARRIVAGGHRPQDIPGIEAATSHEGFGDADHHLGVVGVHPRASTLAPRRKVAADAGIVGRGALEGTAERIPEEAPE